MSPEFLITALVIVATPGTGVLFTLAAGLSRGARASVIAAFGCTLGIVPHMVAAITGLARPRVLIWMRRVFAVTFVALGARLALSER